MEKTITLNETQIKLLKEFQAALNTLNSAREFYDKCIDKTDAEVAEAAKIVRSAFVKHDSAACVFAYSVEAELRAEQGPRVNPEETAGDAGTPA